MPATHVFIVTYGRSGSTLLQNLLNALPGYCIRGENAGALAHLARSVDVLERAQPVQSLRELGRVSGPVHPWYGAEAVDTHALARNLGRVFTEDVLRPPAGTRVTGFKEIRWHADPDFFAPLLDFAARAFPGARFIFNSRDHRAVARSGWWAQQDPERVAAILEDADELFADYVARNPDRCCQLHYDSYTTDLDALRPLFAFLGEGWDGGLVRSVLARRLDHLRTA